MFKLNRALTVAAAVAWLAPALWLAGGCRPSSSGEIHVVTKPEGATVLCDGKEFGISPVTVPRLATGMHLVEVRKPGYVAERRSITLLEARSTSVSFNLEPIQGLALVDSTPQGADVTVDGAFRGKTPLFLVDLPVGDHRIAFTAPGHLPKEVPLNVSDRTPQKVMAELGRNTGTLKITSEPAGATVRLNGNERGQTPCEMTDILPGESSIEVVMDGYQPYVERVTLAARDVKEVHARLTSVPTSLSIESIPEGARIYVDNQFRGPAPLKVSDLEPGEHRLRAELKGYETQVRTVTLGRNASVVEEFRLQRNTGKIVIVSEPAGARVFLNDEDLGVTKPGASDVVSQPLELDGLGPGEYRVQLVLSGYAHTPRKLTLAANQTVALQERLVRRFIADTRIRMRSGAGEIVRDGMMIRTFPDGGIELQLEHPTQPGTGGTIMRIGKDEILSTQPLRVRPQP